MGKVGRGKPFFLKAFGETTAEFRELMLMPEYMVRSRFDCEACGETRRWRDALHDLDDEDMKRFKDCLVYNEFRVLDENRESKKLRLLLSYYKTPSPEIKKISEKQRSRMIAEFNEKWEHRSARLSEAELSQALKEGQIWPYRIRK